jgi:hypothetical protein
MKTSNKLIAALIATLFLGTAVYMTAERIYMEHDTALAEDRVADPEKTPAEDSSGAVVPGNGVKWNRVTLGLRRSFRRGIIEDSSIFRDIRLTFSDGWSQMTIPFYKRSDESYITWFGLSYRKNDSDSIKPEDPGDNWEETIRIRFIKYKENRPSREVATFKKILTKSVESPYGVWNYWEYKSAFCEWTKGRWHVIIQVPLESCGNDSVKTLELRDQIRDRLFAYYKTLK